jgi:hypothetical protein
MAVALKEEAETVPPSVAEKVVPRVDADVERADRREAPRTALIPVSADRSVGLRRQQQKLLLRNLVRIVVTVTRRTARIKIVSTGRKAGREQISVPKRTCAARRM